MDIAIKPYHKIAAAGCILFFLLAQVYQYVLKFTLPDAANPVEVVMQRGSIENQIRYLLILLSIFGLIVSFFVLCRTRYNKYPFLSSLAFLFFMLFCVFEIGYRSVEYFLVIDKWIPAFNNSSDSVYRQAVILKIRDFDSVVRAIYFPLLSCHFLGSIFLLSTTFVSEPAVKLLRWAMLINSVRLIIRLFGFFTDNQFLHTLNNRYYFPLICLVFLLQLYFLVICEKKEISENEHLSSEK